MEVVMKKLAPIAYFAFVLCLFFACSHPAPVPESGLGYVEIIKLEKPEYKEHIMVYAPKKEDGPLAVAVGNSYFCISQEIEPICGTSPYIELPDGYLLLNWRWKRIFDHIINEEAIISDKWAELRDIHTTWGKEQIYVNRPIKEYYIVRLSKINEYYAGQLKYPYIASDICNVEFSEERWKRFSDGEKENMRQETLRLDSAYMEYKAVLSDIIEDGKLAEYAINRRKPK